MRLRKQRLMANLRNVSSKNLWVSIDTYSCLESSRLEAAFILLADNTHKVVMEGNLIKRQFTVACQS